MQIKNIFISALPPLCTKKKKKKKKKKKNQNFVFQKKIKFL